MTSTENVDPVEYKSILDTAEKLQAKVQNLKRATAKPQKSKPVKRIKIEEQDTTTTKKKFKGAGGKAVKKEKNEIKSENGDKKEGKKEKTPKGGEMPFKLDADGNGTEKVDWRELKKQKKALKLKRHIKKNTEDFLTIMEQAKKIWIKLTLKNLGKAEQHEVSNQLLEVLRGNFLKSCWKHDTSRYVQALISKGSPVAAEAVFQELKDSVLLVAQGKYSHWCIVQLLKHGSKNCKRHIITSFEGQIAKLMNSSVGCRVLEEAYNDHATAKERARMIQEFYSLDYRYAKDENIKTLQDAITRKPEKKGETLDRLNALLKKAIEKSRWRLSLFHTLLYEYLNNAEEEDRDEILEAVRENLVEMMHTKEGARVAMISLWKGDKKVRKQIVKSFKGKIVDICKEAHGHRVLLALFDCVDDTVLVTKAIVQEILSNIGDVMSSDSGRKVVLYLVAHRERLFFDADTIQYLATGDGNPHTKKSIADIHSELKASAVPSVTSYIAENISFFAEDNSKVFFLRTLINHLSGRDEIFRSIAEYVATHEWGTVSKVKPFWKMIAFFLNSNEQSDSNEPLSQILIQRWTPDVVKAIAVNFEGSAMLCALISVLSQAGTTDENYTALVQVMKKVAAKEGEETLRKWVNAASTDKSTLDQDFQRIKNLLKKK